MKLFVILGLTVALCGCSSGTVEKQQNGIAADQLVPTLEQIANTGEFREVQTPLTEGLESEGYMDQAVVVQSFQDLKGPSEVKQLARKLLKTLKK